MKFKYRREMCAFISQPTLNHSNILNGKGTT